LLVARITDTHSLKVTAVLDLSIPSFKKQHPTSKIRKQDKKNKEYYLRFRAKNNNQKFTLIMASI
jgi:hypothetical protein